MKILKTEVAVGATKPFRIAHFTDTHLTLADSRDGDEILFHMEDRLRNCGWEFKDMKENYNFILRYAKENPDVQLACTGDLIDSYTKRNLEAAQRLSRETNCFFAVGNHEYMVADDYSGVTLSEEEREQLKASVQTYFSNDLRFATKTVNGVKLIALDNTDHQIEPDILKLLEKEVQGGEPIILMMHAPIHTPAIREASRCDLQVKCNLNRPTVFMGVPEEAKDFYHGYEGVYESIIPTETTLRACELIRTATNIRCVLTGHLHFDYLCDLGDKMQIMTGCNTLREILVY